MRLIQMVLVFAVAFSSPALISSADAGCKGTGKKCPLSKKCHKEGKADEKAAKSAQKSEDNKG